MLDPRTEIEDIMEEYELTREQIIHAIKYAESILEKVRDENVPKSLYQELRRRGYDTKHILFIRRGMKDREIIELANEENRTIITLNEDFVYLSHFLRTKVILIRKK